MENINNKIDALQILQINKLFFVIKHTLSFYKNKRLKIRVENNAENNGLFFRTAPPHGLVLTKTKRLYSRES